jgi:hypothetical protein
LTATDSPPIDRPWLTSPAAGFTGLRTASWHGFARLLRGEDTTRLERLVVGHLRATTAEEGLGGWVLYVSTGPEPAGVTHRVTTRADLVHALGQHGLALPITGGPTE